MAAEVSLPVWLLCDPLRGRQVSPVSVRYPSAARSRRASKASRRSPRFWTRSVRSSSSRDLISEPSCSWPRSFISGAILSIPRSRRWTWACSVFTKPQSRLSRSSASCVPSGGDGAGQDVDRFLDPGKRSLPRSRSRGCRTRRDQGSHRTGRPVRKPLRSVTMFRC